MRKNSKTKFKKFLALFLAMIIMLGVFSGCGKTKPGNNSDVNNSSEKEETGLKLPSIGNISSKLKTTKISKTGLFSEGLCLIELQNEEGTVYCINEEGDIVFKLENQYFSWAQSFLNLRKFYNGLAYISKNTFCDKTGKVTSADDLGVTNLYPCALKEGYILADVITADFDSTKKEFGIMNTDFEWVVEPSAELYSKLCGDSSELYISDGADDEFAQNGYYYIQLMEAFLELSTGEVYYYPEIPFEFPVEHSFFTSDYKFIDPDEKVLIDFSEYYDSRKMNLFPGQFKDGYAPVLFYNNVSNTAFITLIDQKGEMLFKPVEVWMFERSNALTNGFEVTFDGENILVKYGQISMQKAKCFNAKGELLGEFEPDTSNRSSNFYIKINDGIIIYYRSLDMNEYEIINYYKPDFTPLF